MNEDAGVADSPDIPDIPEASAEAIGAVDALFASADLKPGRRATRAGSWRAGERVGRERAPSDGLGAPVESAVPGLEPVPGWERFDWLRAGFSTRRGGRSTVYREDPQGAEQALDQNLGWTQHDEPEIVSAARVRFVAEVLGGAAAELVTIRQFHSGLSSVIDSGHGALQVAERRSALRGDGLITGLSGLLLGVITADCVPILVTDTRTRAVAAFHAGWRGTLARIVERGVGTMRMQYGSRSEDLVAAIGPAIGACCFAVGEEVRSEFESQFGYAPELFQEVYDSDPVREKYPLLFMTARAPGHSNLGPQTHLDLHEANRRQLLDAGLGAEAIQQIAECTACTRLQDGRRKYFSHRSEHGFTGRMLSVIGAVG